MKMQDKELDDIFRSQLEGLEAEPSERVWTGVNDELEASRRRKMWIPVLRVAAVLTLMTTVGLFFVLKRDKIANSYGHKTGIAKSHVQPIVQQQKPGELVAKATPGVQQLAVKKALPNNQAKNIAHISINSKDKSDVAKQPQPVQTPAPAVIKQDEPVNTIAQVSPPIEIKDAVVPNNDVPLTAKLPDESKSTFKTKPVAIVQIAPLDSAKKAKRKGIHSFGDLVNIVANKVQKQRAAAGDDDDESVIAMVNKRVQKMKADRDQQEQAK